MLVSSDSAWIRLHQLSGQCYRGFTMPNARRPSGTAEDTREPAPRGVATSRRGAALACPLARFRERWATRASEFRHLRVMVDGAQLVEDMLLELEAAERERRGSALSLHQAASECGYSIE